VTLEGAAAQAGARLRYEADGELRPAAGTGDVKIIDSWLVAHGRVRDLAAHSRRFSSACAELFGVAENHTGRFMRAVAAQLPASGRWFPRVELALVAGVPRLQLWRRPAPPAGPAVRLWIAGGPDERMRPDVKGFDLDRLARLRQDAVAAGADEAVLLSAAGQVIEGSATSIMWWRGATLCAPPLGTDLLPGVTRAILMQVAAERGVPVAVERALPGDLADLEVWAVNALHGIRPVVSWVGAGIRPGRPQRTARWREYLDDSPTSACSA
jgi:branched-subunit amino acid aminotransferase/4-amino-4-deoxychorismate lyase